eukprot:5773398-Karenia_brevis.AAC.1
MCFLARFHAKDLSRPTFWAHIVMILINKIGHPKALDDFRGISLIAVLAKWYMTALMLLVKSEVRMIRHVRWDRLYIFGFEDGHACTQICSGLSMLVNRGLEWAEQAAVYVASADVRAAFDNLTADV